MTSSVAKQLAQVAVIVATMVSLAEDASAQRRFGKAPPRYVPTASERGDRPRTAPTRARKAQFENDVPQVELPGAAYEADALPAGDYAQGQGMPTVESIVTPSIDDAVESVLQPDSEASYPESTPFAANMADGYLDDGYMMDYDAQYGCEPAPMYSTGTWFRRGSWYTRMDVLALTKSQPREGNLQRTTGGAPLAGLQVVTTDNSISNPLGLPFQEYLTSNLVSHNFAPGAKLSLGRFLGRDAAGRDHQFDFTFMGLFEWDGSRTLTSAADPFAQVATGLNANLFNVADPLIAPFVVADSQTFSYGTDFDSYEWNYYIRTRPGRDQLAMQPNGRWVRHGIGSRLMTVLAGFRVLSYNENISFFSTAPNQDQTFRDGLYTVTTHNDMFGFQLGFESEEKYDEWSWGLRGKGGCYINYADRISRITTFDDGILDGAAGEALDSESIAFLADTGVFGAYQLRPNLHFRGSYNFMLLSAVAMAPENMRLESGFAQVNVNGTVFMHGGSLGFEATW